MRYFKTEDSLIRAIDIDQESLIEESWTEVTRKKADRILSDEEKKKFDSLSYVEKRIAHYPPVADYLDAIVKGDEVQRQKYIDDCSTLR